MDEVDLLMALVREYSPSGHEAGAVRRFIEAARSLGLTANADAAGNGIARLGSGPPSVMFLGHIDTVEGELPIRLDGRRLYGRGACDAKGALAAALVAAHRHAGPGEIVVVGAVGEERDSRGTRHLLTRARPDFLIVGEPSGWDGVTIGYKGNLSLVLRLEGERTHLSSPAATTVETGLAFVERLRAFCDAHAGPTPFHSLTMKTRSINTTQEGSREHVEIGLNLRLPPGVDLDDVQSFIDRNRGAIECETVDASAAIEVDSRNDVVRALCAGIRKQGSRPTLLRKLGTSDLNLAAPAWGCPAAAYGPGDSHLDHTDAENVDVHDLRRSIEVLREAFSILTAPDRMGVRLATAELDAPRS